MNNLNTQADLDTPVFTIDAAEVSLILGAINHQSYHLTQLMLTGKAVNLTLTRKHLEMLNVLTLKLQKQATSKLL